MTAFATVTTDDETLPPAGKTSLRAGVVGNWIDNIHVFLPLTALAPAMLVLAGPAAAGVALHTEDHLDTEDHSDVHREGRPR